MWNTAMDVGEWLRGLGLGQYETNFRENKIDAYLLPQLTDAGLKDIGVFALGDRLRLLSAIAALADLQPPPDVPATPSKASQPRGSAVSAERRPITVMFCDLVGSTSLAAKLDPEDWRTLVNTYLDEASRAVTGLGGHVLKRLGDGLMALFGYPQAQENDAERAVRAALAIQRALADINLNNHGKSAPELLARIGVESGPAVVEATGEVFGDAPNVAARVQAAAEAGSVLVTMNIQRQVAGLFVAEEQGARELKGVTEPVQLFRIVRASGGGRKGGARTRTRFVGREEELSILARRWERTRAGEGQLVLIVGEPGLGKSRLVEEFRARLAETPHTWVEWSASQLLQNTALHPIAEWGRQRFGVDATTEQRLEDLQNTLRLVGLDPAEHAPLLAPLVDVPLPPDRVASFPPEEMRRRQLASMTAWYLAGARSQPAVLAFEDLHWADPTSLDLFRALAERGAQAPLLLLATARPEFRPPWSLRSHHTVISLSPLDRAGVAQMVGEILSRRALSKEVVEGVSERTGGVPLFVEEVTRLLLERGEQGGVQAIPPTLQQSLAARLDRLGPAREVAQIGAVLGRDFAYQLLRDVAEADESGLKASLERLAEADLLFVEGAPPQATYRFKHALIQDAAYDSLLKSRRQALHRRAAELLRDDPEHAASEPEVIAHHFTQAGNDDTAIEWWGKAGDQALRRSAFQEAIAHLGKAIAMADKAASADSASAARDDAASHRRMRLQTDYGQAVMWSKGFAAEETKAAFTRAAELATRSDDFLERFAAAHGQWTMAFVRSELRSASELASAFLREAEEAGRLTEAGVARRGLAIISYYAGNFIEARTHCEQALAVSDFEHDQDAREHYGEYTVTVATACLAVTTWCLGEVERARELIEIATRRATELGHPPSMAGQLFQRCKLEILRGDAAAALNVAEALEALSREHGVALFCLWAELLAAWARGRLRDPAIGAAELRQALTTLRDQGLMLAVPFFHALLAELEAEALGVERALACIEEALALAHQLEQSAELAFVHRLHGQVLLKRDPASTESAEQAFRTAIAIAQQQGARSFQLLASLSLAKLHQSTNRPAEGHAVLASALYGFSPTAEMPEIAKAEALLAQLAATEEMKTAEAQRQQRLHLQTSYSQALMWSKGYVAEETRAAFARVGELAAQTENSVARSQTRNAQFVGSLARGEMDAARKTAESFLYETEADGRPMEAAHARRLLGGACYLQGELVLARGHFQQVLAGYEPEWDMDVRRLFGADTRIIATSYLAMSTWLLGDIQDARRLIEQAVRDATASNDVVTIAQVYFFEAMFEAIREDAAAARRAGERACEFSREHGVVFFGTASQILSAWARGRLLDPTAGAKDLRETLALYVEQGNKVWAPCFQGLIADLEAISGRSDAALGSVAGGIALAQEAGERWTDSALFRRKGEILLRRDPRNAVPAAEAFQSATAIAKKQGARSFGLRAALSLTKLYQTAGRPADAHAVLAPALEGFSPTPEMPEIAEAQTLLAALAASEPVAAELRRRETRSKLHAGYALATMMTKGFSAEETKAALARATRASETARTPEYWIVIYGRINAEMMSGAHRAARAGVEAFLAEAEAAGLPGHAAFARRMLGFLKLLAGDLSGARADLERALSDCDERRDESLRTLFALDLRSNALIHLGYLAWHVGDFEEAKRLTDEAIARAKELAQPGSYAVALFNRLLIGAACGLAEDVLGAAEEMRKLAEEHDLKFWRATASTYADWAQVRMGEPRAEAFRAGLVAYADLGALHEAAVVMPLLAEVELAAGRRDEALAAVERGLSLAAETGLGLGRPRLLRLRGDALAETDSIGAVSAYREALSVAGTQGARTSALMAALALAKLLQSKGETAEAHTVLSEALEGFSPTPLFPAIAEAQALMERLAYDRFGRRSVFRDRVERRLSR